MHSINSPARPTSPSVAAPGATSAAKPKNPITVARDGFRQDPPLVDNIHRAVTLSGKFAPPAVKDLATAAVLIPGLSTMAEGAKKATAKAYTQIAKLHPQAKQAVRTLQENINETLKKHGVQQADLDALEGKFGHASSKEIAREALRLFDQAIGGSGDAQHLRRKLECDLAEYGRAKDNLALSRLRNVSAPCNAGAALLSLGSKATGLSEAGLSLGESAKGGAENLHHATGAMEKVTQIMEAAEKGLGVISPPLRVVTTSVQAVASGANTLEHYEESRIIQKDIGALEHFDKPSPQVRETVMQELSHQKWRKSGQVVGDGITTIGKVLQSISLDLIGLPLSVVGWGIKNAAEDKMKKAQGADASDSAKASLEQEASARERVVEEGLDEALQQVEQDYRLGMELAAEGKLCLDVLRALPGKYKRPLDAQHIRSKVKQRLKNRGDHLKYDNWRTTLVPADFKLANRILRAYPDVFFSGTKADICSRIYDRLSGGSRIAGIIASSETFKQAVLDGLLEKVPSSRATQIKDALAASPDKWAELDSIASRDPEIKNIYHEMRARLLAKQVKEDGKFLRAAFRQQIVKLADIHKINQK